MNSNQYLVVGFFFVVLMFYLPITMSGMVHHESVYFGVKDGIHSAIIWLSFPLSLLFFVLAWLEAKKK